MVVMLYGDDDNNKKLYIIIKSDDNSECFVYTKDYIHNPDSNWDLVGGNGINLDNLDNEDERYEIILLAEIDSDCVYSKNVPELRELRINHLSSFLKQTQNDMNVYMQDKNGCDLNIINNLKIYKKCKDDIKKAVEDVYIFQLSNWDLDDCLNCVDYAYDWEKTYNDVLIPRNGKGDNGIDRNK